MAFAQWGWMFYCALNWQWMQLKYNFHLIPTDFYIFIVFIDIIFLGLFHGLFGAPLTYIFKQWNAVFINVASHDGKSVD